VVVLFTNEWNGSAIIVEGALDELQQRWNEKFHFVQISKDECKKIGEQYKVRFTPTILIFKNGEVIEEITGVKSKNTIENILQNLNSMP
jgi:thioredoxin 1